MLNDVKHAQLLYHLPNIAITSTFTALQRCVTAMYFVTSVIVAFVDVAFSYSPLLLSTS